MASAAPASALSPVKPKQIPSLAAGDHLTRDEFERRYEAMPDLKKAELIEGVVYMPSPVNQKQHGGPHLAVAGWVAAYQAATPGVDAGDNSTVRLDLDNEPQPDILLMVSTNLGGQARIDADGYVAGSPELIVEVAATSASYDLYEKLNAYRRNGVREYLVWRVLDGELDWFVLRGSEYVRQQPDNSGLLRSEVFPGLWLDAVALLRRDLTAVFEKLQKGLASPEHAEFVSRLQKRAAEQTGS